MASDPHTDDLADRLEDWPYGKPAFSKSECLEAAARLRHLHAENERLRAEVDRLRTGVRVLVENRSYAEAPMHDDVRETLARLIDGEAPT